MRFVHADHAGRSVRLAYCLNLHPADDLEGALALYIASAKTYHLSSTSDIASQLCYRIAGGPVTPEKRKKNLL